MKEPKKILYIGNNLTKKTKYPTTLETLSNLLKSEKYIIYTSSNKTNKVIRLLDMCFSVFYYSRKIDYILIDTYSTTNFYYAFFTSQLARIFKIKYIPILHGGNLPFRLENSKTLSKLIFSNSYINVAPSNYLKKEFEDRNYSVVLIPNVISIKDYKFKERIRFKPKLLFVRSFANIYNPTMAINVMRNLREKNMHAKLCMIGPDKDDGLKKLKKLAENLCVDKNIEFTGVLSKDVWHKKSEEFDIFINTTNVDNTPVSIIEAMALGLPVVSTNVGGLSYLINNNIDGILVRKNDDESMTNAIIELINFQEKALEIARNARNKIKKFDSRIVKKQWINLLN
jgi:glycosyltransferase involved in cell wall biosynthesis